MTKAGVAELGDKLVVFTPREGPSDFYASFVAGNIKLDIRRLRPADVISIALPPEKQDQQNVRKLKQLSDTAWRQLVDEIYRNGNTADEALLKELLGRRSRLPAGPGGHLSLRRRRPGTDEQPSLRQPSPPAKD